MNEAYESLMDGPNEALAFARGDKTGPVVYHVAVPSVDVAAIRASTGLSPRARCSTGSMAAVARPGLPGGCSP